MRNFVFHNPVKILFGAGQVENIGREAALAGRKALMITGRGSAEKSGLLGKVRTRLDEAQLSFAELSGVKPNPDINLVRRGVEACRVSDTDLVLAVGGGSVIDTAKAIAAGALYGGDPWDFLEKKARPDKALPVGCVLTLAATGSEANGNSVISNPATSEKRAMYHGSLYPVFSILDPELTFTVPAGQTAYGAVDIMSHVFEQYFHDVEGCGLQDGMAEAIMKTVIEYAPRAIRNPGDYTARANLMWASSLALNDLIGAGAAGDWTCHMLEHELSAKYDIAHGAGLAVVFPSWMRLVAPRRPGRFARYAANVWGVDPTGKSEAQVAMEGVEATRRFFKDTLGVGVTLADYGIGGALIEEMADTVTRQRGERGLGGLTQDDLVEIYKAALA